jgi:hypothetical protein
MMRRTGVFSMAKAKTRKRSLNRNEENLEKLLAFLDFICDENTWLKSLKRLSARI